MNESRSCTADFSSSTMVPCWFARAAIFSSSPLLLLQGDNFLFSVWLFSPLWRKFCFVFFFSLSSCSVILFLKSGPFWKLPQSELVPRWHLYWEAVVGGEEVFTFPKVEQEPMLIVFLSWCSATLMVIVTEKCCFLPRLCEYVEPPFSLLRFVAQQQRRKFPASCS